MNLNSLYQTPCHQESVPKKTANYPHFVDKGGGGPKMWISDGRGGGRYGAYSQNVDSLAFFLVPFP